MSPRKRMISQNTINQEDPDASENMNFLSKLIKEMTVCKSIEGDWPVLKEQADRIFRTIADYPNPVDYSQSIKLYKVDKKKLKRFL